jgi:hypothetical protein
MGGRRSHDGLIARDPAQGLGDLFVYGCLQLLEPQLEDAVSFL